MASLLHKKPVSQNTARSSELSRPEMSPPVSASAPPEPAPSSGKAEARELEFVLEKTNGERSVEGAGRAIGGEDQDPTGPASGMSSESG